MTALARANVVVALLAVGAAAGAGAHRAWARPVAPSCNASGTIADLQSACELTCDPIRARWSAGVDGNGLIVMQCSCEKLPELGVGPKVRRVQKPKEKTP